MLGRRQRPELSSSRVARLQQVSLQRCWRAERAASSALSWPNGSAITMRIICKSRWIVEACCCGYAHGVLRTKVAPSKFSESIREATSTSTHCRRLSGREWCGALKTAGPDGPHAASWSRCAISFRAQAGFGERIWGTDRAFFLKVAHCRAVEMYDSVRRVQGEGSLADAPLREPHYLSRRKHQTTGGKHGKFRL